MRPDDISTNYCCWMNDLEPKEGKHIMTVYTAYH